MFPEHITPFSGTFRNLYHIVISRNFSCAKVVHDKKIITYPLSYQISHQSFVLISALESTDRLDDIYIYENLGLVRDLIRKMPCLDVLKYISDIVNMFYIIIIFCF